jgi:hypothetical protein
MTTVYQDFKGGYYTTGGDASYTAIGETAPQEVNVIDKESHLNTGELFGVQTLEFCAHIRGSVDYFQKNPTKAVWTVPEKAYSHLQKPTSKIDRHTSKEVVGDLSRTIILGATVTEVQNTFNMPMGVDVNQLVPSQITAHGRHNYVIPSKVAFANPNKDIFEPIGIFTKDDYIKVSLRN